MKVEDGVVRALNVEPRNENLGVSSADHMLQLLQAKPQETVA
jgi:peroxiredoxin